MSTSSQNNPHEGSSSNEAGQYAYAELIGQWQEFLAEADLKTLMENASEVEITDDGDIHVINTPEGLSGDFAIVDMSKVKVDTPHFHKDETEIHFALQGDAVMSVGTEIDHLQVGNVRAISAEIPHFLIPGDEYIVGVLSVPGYNPDNQIVVDPADAPDDFNADLYLESVA